MQHFYQNIQPAPACRNHFDFQDIYKKIIRACPENFVSVEVGIYKGQSLAYLAVEAINSEKFCTLYGVDKFTDFHASNKVENDFFRQTQENLLSVQHIVHLVKNSSVLAAKDFDGKADFVFIDADHDYDNVWFDIVAWQYKCGGLIGGHDYNQEGVKKAVDECFGNKVVVLESPRRRTCWMVNMSDKEWCANALHHIVKGREHERRNSNPNIESSSVLETGNVVV